MTYRGPTPLPLFKQTRELPHLPAFLRHPHVGKRRQHPRRPGTHGHADVKTTEIYTHVMEKDISAVLSPLDQLS